MELALGGDVTCLRMMLDRVCPIRKGRPVNVDMPPIRSSHDFFAAIAAIWTAIGEGRLIPSAIDQNPCAHWRNPMDMIRQG